MARQRLGTSRATSTPAATTKRREQEVVRQRATDHEERQAPGPGVDVVQHDTAEADGDHQPADCGRHPEAHTMVGVMVDVDGRATRRLTALGLLAHSTTTAVTHFVCSTPGRLGAIRRSG